MPVDLPAELVVALRAVRRVEVAAEDQVQRGRAVAATARLLLAAQRAGWALAWMAPHLGISPQAAQKRVERARLEGAVVALNLPLRPRKRDPLEVLQLPIGEREWLSMAEAMEHAEISFYTLRVWRRSGLLPRTQWPRARFALYHRGDLDRVLAAPAYNGQGHSYAAVRAAIAKELHESTRTAS